MLYSPLSNKIYFQNYALVLHLALFWNTKKWYCDAKPKFSKALCLFCYCSIVYVILSIFCYPHTEPCPPELCCAVSLLPYCLQHFLLVIITYRVAPCSSPASVDATKKTLAAGGNRWSFFFFPLFRIFFLFCSLSLFSFSSKSSTSGPSSQNLGR